MPRYRWVPGIVASLLIAGIGIAQADPWKDESGNRGRDRGPAIVVPVPPWAPPGPPVPRSGPPGERRGGIPPGHMPPPGEGRLWFPDRPPGQQPPPQRY